MDKQTLTVALIRDVFFDRDPQARLIKRLQEAKSKGAELAILPEIALNPWSPATKEQNEEDAEPPQGPRHQMQAAAAREVGIGLVGAAIVKDAETQKRHNNALVFDANGQFVHSYAKMNIPEEAGFWESSHYEAGEDLPTVTNAFDMKLGIQICSDNNRPVGTQILAAQGVQVIAVPRSTTMDFYQQWKFTFQANAWTSASYVLSVNRPAAEQGVRIAGPSFAVAPNGEVILETAETVAVITLQRKAVEEARKSYPGYLIKGDALFI